MAGSPETDGPQIPIEELLNEEANPASPNLWSLGINYGYPRTIEYPTEGPTVDAVKSIPPAE